MSAISLVDEIHLIVAFLIILCAVFLGWIQTGRRVMMAIIGVQFVIGLIYAGILGGAISAIWPRIGEHVLGAILATGFYAIGRRMAQKSTSPVVPIVFSALGLLLVLGTAYLGLKMHGRIQ